MNLKSKIKTGLVVASVLGFTSAATANTFCKIKDTGRSSIYGQSGTHLRSADNAGGVIGNLLPGTEVEKLENYYDAPASYTVVNVKGFIHESQIDWNQCMRDVCPLSAGGDKYSNIRTSSLKVTGQLDAGQYVTPYSERGTENVGDYVAVNIMGVVHNSALVQCR